MKYRTILSLHSSTVKTTVSRAFTAGGVKDEARREGHALGAGAGLLDKLAKLCYTASKLHESATHIYKENEDSWHPVHLAAMT